MSIIILSTNYKPKTGGISEFTYQVSLGLQHNGMKVILFAPCYQDELIANDFDLKRPFKTIRLLPVWHAREGIKATIIYKFYLFYRAFSKIIKIHKVNYVLATDLGVYSGLMGLLRFLVVLVGCKILGIVFHGQDVDAIFPKMTFFKRLLLKRIILKMDNIFCNSRFTASMVESTFSASIQPVVVGCGVNSDTLPPFRSQKIARKKLNIEAHYVLLTIAELVPRKGIDMVIRALPAIISRFPDLIYIVAGGGHDLSRLLIIAEQVGCAEHVRFDGRFDDHMIADYYCSADLFVMPSRRIPNESVEGFGIVYLEAGHYGLPVIGGRAGGVPDAVINGKTGLLVDPNDQNEISKAVIKILEDPVLSQNHGAEGKRRVHEEFTWDSVIKRFLAGVDSSISNR